MAYEDFLRKLNITQLKHIIKKYKLNTKIVVGNKKREELIQELLKHTDLDEKGENIIVKEVGIIKNSDIPNFKKNAGDYKKMTTAVLMDYLKFFSDEKYQDLRTEILAIISKRKEQTEKRKDKTRFSNLSIEELRKRINKAIEEEDASAREVYQNSLDYKLKLKKTKK
jgi:23S rRNA maturation mini-RNase III